jgi:two-component system cell cycle response regulator
MKEIRILVADDSRKEMELLQHLLQAQGYQVVSATNGRDAFQLAQQTRPHLVISDIEMPLMNGYQLCHLVKTDVELRTIPVILLTTLSRLENILRALEARADSYLTKPFDQKYLLSRIRDLLAYPPPPLEGKEAVETLEVSVGGMRHRICAGRQQMLNLLLCTYEHAREQNMALSRVQQDLQNLNAQLRRQAQHLESSRADFRDLLENNTDAMIVIDCSGTVRYVNPAAQVLFGRTQDEFLGRAFDFFVMGGEHKEVEILRNGDGRRSSNVAADKVLAEMRVVETNWEADCAYLATLRDITERKHYEQQLAEQQKKLEAANAALEALATSDSLTGLKNRRAFKERLAEEMRRASRYQLPISLMLMDVDKFKQYNDTFGHPAGDEVLRRVAKLLQAGARASDFVARYGGEEFVVVLPNTDAEGALFIANRLRTIIESAKWIERPVTSSGGVATMFPKGVGDDALNQEAEILIAEADKALYQSKENGRNRVTPVIVA